MKFFFQWVVPFVLLACALPSMGQSASEIVRKAEEKLRGEKAYAEMKMTIIRPTWTREITMKSWALGEDYSLVLITSPARDKGTAFLKRGRELWNWQPTIERTIKMPPSMMMQSWMGSDFTNDDLVRESSLKNDFTHELAGEETIDGRPCYKIVFTPKPNAAVVWGKVIMWIDKKDYLELKAEFYDEDGYLVNTIYGKNIKMLGGRLLPATMELIPAEKPGHKTILEYLKLDFNVNLTPDFFSLQNLRRLK
ncbi:MAG: outer membrane lipoprotein-sorting protein [Saprospiraceae bacterium]|nr:MAG: outer membrane lipoprotein-sorting protein [Saprospiraceae bacterium]